MIGCKHSKQKNELPKNGTGISKTDPKRSKLERNDQNFGNGIEISEEKSIKGQKKKLRIREHKTKNKNKKQEQETRTKN